MKKTTAVLLAGLVLPSFVYSQQVEREWPAEAVLDVDAAGQVSSVTLLDEFPEAIATAAEAVMARWRFKPVEKNGHPVSARTYAFVQLRVVKRNQTTFGLQVVYRSNGPRLHPTVSPFSASSAALASSGAALLIEALVQPDGRVGPVKVVESHFGSQNHLVSSTAVLAVKRWRGDPEYVDGNPVATLVQIPVINCGTLKDCEGPKQELKLWHRAAAVDASAPPATGRSVALNSPLEPLAVQPGG